MSNPLNLHFNEAMFNHYSERLRTPLPPKAREFCQQQLDHFYHRMELLYPFDQLLKDWNIDTLITKIQTVQP